MSDIWITMLGCVGGALYIYMAMLAGRMAEGKGYSYAMGFCLCFLLSPLTAWIVLAMLPERTQGGPRVSPELLLEIELEKARMEARKKVPQP